MALHLAAVTRQRGGTMSGRISGRPVAKRELVIAIVLASVISAIVAASATLRMAYQACNAPDPVPPNDTRQP
jgi:hypothetical protein